MIDVHVHLRDGIQAEKETIVHGMHTAALCGITAVFDMPNTAPALTDRTAVMERLKLGEASARQVGNAMGGELFYGVYGGVTDDPTQLEAMVSIAEQNFPLVVGLKMFAGHSTGEMGLVTYARQRSVYESLALLGYTGVLAVHCEKEQLMRPDLWDPDHPESHCLARPAEAEIASVADQIAAVRDTGFQGALHICHISTAGALDLVRQARQEGLRITCGATAHHALLDDSVASTPHNLCRMNPPLRSVEDRDAIFHGLCDGSVDWIESDHAPHTLADKMQGASGVPGFAGYALLVCALRQAQVSEAHLRRLCGERASRIYGVSLPVNVPSSSFLESALSGVRNAYPWDPFKSLDPRKLEVFPRGS